MLYSPNPNRHMAQHIFSVSGITRAAARLSHEKTFPVRGRMLMLL
jgi:hypothetical protein